MKYKVAAILLFALVGRAVGQSEISNPPQTITIDDKNNMVIRDSLGNELTREKALELLRTGNYISVPSMNQFMQIEHVIRKPRKEDEGKYETLTDGDIVMNMTGSARVNFKFNPGDTIPAVRVMDTEGNQLSLTDSNTSQSNIILIFIKEDNAEWRYNLRPYVKLLCTDFPDVSFVLCPTSLADFDLGTYFLKRDLKRLDNLFLAQRSFSDAMDVNSFNTYMAVNGFGKVKFWVPPIPNENAFSLLSRYLSSEKK